VSLRLETVDSENNLHLLATTDIVEIYGSCGVFHLPLSVLSTRVND